MKTSVLHKAKCLGLFYLACMMVLWAVRLAVPSLGVIPSDWSNMVLLTWIVLSWFVDFDPYRWLDKLKPESAAPPEAGEQPEAG
jgi:hypothetical protein